MTPGPKISVVIPTYNRSAWLRRTLESLAAQDLPRGEFEVVVVDDGSSDDSCDVARSFQDRLRLTYLFQEDLGYRVATARNAGAAAASAPVVAFLDSGTLAGPGWLRAHLAAHERPGAVLGYCYGYQPYVPVPDLERRLATDTPAELVRAYATNPAFQDMRHARLAARDFDLGSFALPWRFFWSMNFSVTARDLAAVGGFDESFRNWGVEDLELGYRMHAAGVPLRFDLDAWAVEGPHERATEANIASGERNAWKFLGMHPEPAVEIFVAHETGDRAGSAEDDFLDLVGWRGQVAGRSVEDEVGRALRALPAGTSRVAVVGAGHRLPGDLDHDLTLVDFDAAALDDATRQGAGGTARHALGVHTGLADGAVDAVLLTSRLDGLWDTWGEDLLREAHRIGTHVSRTA